MRVTKMSAGLKIVVQPKSGGYHDRAEFSAFQTIEFSPGESVAAGMAVLFSQLREGVAMQARAYRDGRKLEIAELLVGVPESMKEEMLATIERETVYIMAGDVAEQFGMEGGDGE